MHPEGKVIHAPLIVASEIAEGSYTVCPVRILARSPSPDEDGYPFKDNGNLRGTTQLIRLGDFASQHVRVPSGRRLRILTDDVDVLKNDASISHSGFSSLATLPSIQLGSSPAPFVQIRLKALREVSDRTVSDRLLTQTLPHPFTKRYIFVLR